MSLAHALLKHRFPTRRRDVQLLFTFCGRIGLSKEQQQHLCEKVFYTEQALDYFLEKYRGSEQEAEAYLVSMAPCLAVPSVSVPEENAFTWLRRFVTRLVS